MILTSEQYIESLMRHEPPEDLDWPTPKTDEDLRNSFDSDIERLFLRLSEKQKILFNITILELLEPIWKEFLREYRLFLKEDLPDLEECYVDTHQRLVELLEKRLNESENNHNLTEEFRLIGIDSHNILDPRNVPLFSAGARVLDCICWISVPNFSPPSPFAFIFSAIYANESYCAYQRMQNSVNVEDRITNLKVRNTFLATLWKRFRCKMAFADATTADFSMKVTRKSIADTLNTQRS